MTGWLILGGSGHARSLASIIRGRGDRVAAVSDSGLPVEPVAGSPEAEAFRNLDGTLPRWFTADDEGVDFAVAEGLAITIGIGANGVRRRIADRLLADPRLSALAPALVARSATVDVTAELGAYTQVAEHAHVGPLSQVGTAVIVNTAAVVEHDCFVGAGTHLAPGSVLLGAVRVGSGAFLGSGSRVLPGLELGDETVLGAGAVATRPLDGMATYVGVPARRLPSTKGPAH
ncbi:UDP-perosamine 4-acetyltransferase [Arthrobacter woluwensis]|nr:UDP-perosamine 4-acetyltransferase [Arthrobacter woluwensis]